MKKRIYIIITAIVAFAVLSWCSTVHSASASISASSSSVNVGESATVTVNVNAAAWNVNVSGATSGSIVGYDDDGNNKSTSKSYTIDTSSPGTYTVSISGDVTDESGANSSVSDSTTITVVQPAQPEPEPEPEPEPQPQQNSPSSNSSSNSSESDNSSNTPEMNFTNTSYTGECSGDGINVRSGPSTDTSSVGTLSKGETVNVIGTGNGWVKISYKGNTAYVSAQFIQQKKEEETNTVTNTTTEQGATNEAANIIVSSNTVNTVAKDIGTSLGIKSLEIVEIPKFKEQFDWQNHDYTLQVQNMDKLTFKVVANPEGAKYEIIGNNEFQEGENVITITVKSQDGKEKEVYQITVIKTTGEAKKSIDGITKGLITVGIIVAVLIISLIIVFIIRRRKERQYEEEINIGNEDLERATNRKKKNFDEDGNYIGKEEQYTKDEEDDLEEEEDLEKTGEFKEEKKIEENKEEKIEENETKKDKLDELLSNEEKKATNKSIDDYLNEYRKKNQIKKPIEDVEKDLTKGSLLDEEIDKHINKDKIQDTGKIDKFELEVKEERFKDIEKDDYDLQEDDYIEDDEVLSKLDKLNDDFEDDLNEDLSIDGKIDEIDKEEKIELDFNKKDDNDIFGRKNKGKHGY